MIILTDYGVMQSAIDALRLGADDIARKPCEIDELIPKIRHCLEKRNLLLEREQSMKALRESEDRNRSIVNASPDGIIIADMDGQILMVSPAGVSMFGYDPDDKYQGHWVSEFIAPEDRERALSNITSKFQNVKTVPNEYLGLRKDGSTFDIEVNNDFIRSADGQIIRIVFIVRDISERKRAEVALHESKTFNLAILNALPAEIAVLDPDGVIIAVNDSWRRFALENGIEDDKPVPNIEVGANYLSVCKAVTGIESDDALRSYEGIQSVLDGRLTKFNLEYPCHAPWQERWFSMDVTSLSLDRKRGVVVVHTNITKLKKAEEALRVSEEKYRTVADFTYAMETWRTPDGKYQYVSPSCERITGYTVAEFLADPNLMIKISHPEDQSKVIEHYKVANRGTETENMGIDYRILTPNGDIRWIGHSCTAVHNSSGAQLGRRESYRDITNRKRTEEEKEKLEVQNRLLQKAESLSRMAGAIAHHFNNKLHVVMGQLEMAKEELARGETPHSNLAAAMLAADQAVEVSRMLLIYLGQVTGKQEPLGLSEVCRNALFTLRAGAPKAVKIEVDLPSPGPVVKANAKQIQQILSYLVTNAWESADDAQQCTIHLSTGTVSPDDIPTSHRFPIQWQPCRDSYACLEVRDSGCGITDENLEEIFSPFFSTKFTGRGLGLSMVLGLVQAHGGVITVESTSGNGSVFRVFLPTSAEMVPPSAIVTDQSAELQQAGTVLLVDDEEIVVDITSRMLSRLGFTVLSASDGYEALELFRQHRADIRLVLSDVSMPIMNGLDIHTALRKIAPDIPVILASGYSEEQVMDGTNAERPQAFLGKPYGFDALRDVIRRTLKDTGNLQASGSTLSQDATKAQGDA